MNSFNKKLFESFDSLESCTLKENAKNELVSWMYDNFPDNSFYKEGKLGNGDTVYYFDKHGDMEAVKKAIKDKFGDRVDFGTGRSEYAPERSEFVVICKKKPKLKEASTKDTYLRDIAKEAYDTGKPYDRDDFNTFRKIGREDGYVLTHSDFDKYFEYYEEDQSNVEESDDLNKDLLGESETIGDLLSEIDNALTIGEIESIGKRFKNEFDRKTIEDEVNAIEEEYGDIYDMDEDSEEYASILDELKSCISSDFSGEEENLNEDDKAKSVADKFSKDKEEGKIPERVKKIADQERYDRLFAKKSEEGMSEERFKSIYGERPKTGLEENYTGKDLDDTAMWVYKNCNRDSEWDNFTDDELVELMSLCCYTDTNPGGRAYDDEVFDALMRRPNGEELIKKGQEIAVNKAKEAEKDETYHIIVWETEEDRNNGDPSETMEEYDSKEEAIKDAKKLARDNACVEVKNSIGKTVFNSLKDKLTESAADREDIDDIAEKIYELIGSDNTDYIKEVMDAAYNIIVNVITDPDFGDREYDDGDTNWAAEEASDADERFENRYMGGGNGYYGESAK